MESVTSGSFQSSSGGEADEFSCNTADSLSAIFHSAAAAAALVSHPAKRSPANLRLCALPSDGNFFDPISYLATITSTAPAWPARPPEPEQADAAMPTPVQPLYPPVPPASDTAPRGSKKRSRASRRAQTTVLTTDTSNFRAMVQQFTGIPSPPFDLAAFSPLARSRFSLFRPPSPSSFASSSSPFLLRPFPLKPQISTLTANPTIATTPATDSTSVATPSVYSTTIADLNPSAQIPPIDRNQSASADAGELIGRRSLQSLLDEMPVFFSGSTEPVKPGSSGLELGSCKLNFLTPGSSGFSAEKGVLAASTQGGEEDATDSWINFSSD